MKYNKKKISKLENITYTRNSALNSQINLKYPLQWKSNITDNGNSFQTILEDMSFVISLRNTTSDSLDELTFKQKNILRQEFPGLKNSNLTKVITNNFLGYKYTFGIDDFKIMRIWTMEKNKDILLTFISNKSGFDIYLPVIKKIINSITITS